jgi:hypothetical protein
MVLVDQIGLAGGMSVTEFSERYSFIITKG